jgi:hypothetical protein
MTAIDMVNCDFKDERLFIHSSLKNLHMQMEALTWDDKHKENPSLPNDLCDGTLYAHRFSRHYWGKIRNVLTKQQQFEQEILDYATTPARDPFDLF